MKQRAAVVCLVVSIAVLSIHPALADRRGQERKEKALPPPTIVNTYIPTYPETQTITLLPGEFTDLPLLARQVDLPRGVAVITWSVMVADGDENGDPLDVSIRPVIGDKSPKEGLFGHFANPPGSDGGGHTGTWATEIDGGKTRIGFQASALHEEQGLFMGDWEDFRGDEFVILPMSASWTVVVYPGAKLK